MLAVGSVTGLLEIDRAEERILGVDTSFWIAVALTYLEFLEEREVYLICDSFICILILKTELSRCANRLATMYSYGLYTYCFDFSLRYGHWTMTSEALAWG